MEHDLEKDYGVTNAAINWRHEKRFNTIKAVVNEADRKWSTIYEYIQRFTNRYVKFIKCLMSSFLEMPLIDMAADLIRLYA